jgi:hypothetical protein
MANSTRTQIIDALLGIEVDLSVIMQFMRQLANGSYVIEPQGMAVMEGMVFTASLRLSSVGDEINQHLQNSQAAFSAASSLMKLADDNAAEIREATAMIRRLVEVLHCPESRSQADQTRKLIQSCLTIIEKRTLAGEQPKPTNVVQFVSRAALENGMSPTGGAA